MRSSSPTTGLILLIAALGPLGSGCGPAEKAGPTTPDASSGPGGGEVLFSAEREGLTPEMADNLRRRDPGVDGWQTEVLHDAAKVALGTFLDGLLAQGGDDGGSFESVLDPAFDGCAPLRPLPLSEAFDDGVTRVLRATPEHSLAGREQMRDLAGALLEPFQGHPVHWFRKIHKVELEGDTFVTDVIVHLDGRGEGGGTIQQNMDWRVTWSVADDDVLMRSLEVEFFEEVLARRPLFSDLTTHLFGSFAEFEREFLHGVEHYQNRTDRLVGGSFLGMQGLAIADVDGDGLDDL